MESMVRRRVASSSAGVPRNRLKPVESGCDGKSPEVRGRACVGGTGARLTLVHGPITFSDWMLLVEFGGAWKIASKVYSTSPTK